MHSIQVLAASMAAQAIARTQFHVGNGRAAPDRERRRSFVRQASSIQLDLHDGTRLRVPQAAGAQAYLLRFMRMSSCPPCLAHVRHIDAELETLRALGAQPVVVVPGGIDAARQMRERFKLHVPVASGADGDVHSLFGLEKQLFGIAQQSGTVLIDAAGVIRHQRAATLPIDSYRHAEVIDALHALVPAPESPTAV